jgi:hypothetical protein
MAGAPLYWLYETDEKAEKLPSHLAKPEAVC